MRRVSIQLSRRAFTLIELLFATGIGLVVAGVVVLLLVQTGREQNSGLASAMVERYTHTLQSKISGVLRGVSVNQGVTPDYSTGTLINGYKSIIVFNATNGGYVAGKISFDDTSGRVTYTPDNAIPATQELWMTNTVTCRLKDLRFNTSFNLDGSDNASLVTVSIKMDDNEFSQHDTNATYPASVERKFAIQMRND